MIAGAAPLHADGRGGRAADGRRLDEDRVVLDHGLLTRAADQ